MGLDYGCGVCWLEGGGWRVGSDGLVVKYVRIFLGGEVEEV